MATKRKDSESETEWGEHQPGNLAYICIFHAKAEDTSNLGEDNPVTAGSPAEQTASQALSRSHPAMLRCNPQVVTSALQPAPSQC